MTNTQRQPRYRLSVSPWLSAGSTKRERSIVAHTPAALRDWANRLRTVFAEFVER